MNIPASPAQKHRQEWLDSGVSPEIIALNMKSVGEQEAIELILGDAIASRQKVTSYATVGTVNLLEHYSHLENGGWWVAGINPLYCAIDSHKRFDSMEWGQLKPDTPRKDPRNFTKTIKYEAVKGATAKAFLGRCSYLETLETCIMLGVHYGETFQGAIEAAIQRIEATDSIAKRGESVRFRYRTDRRRSGIIEDVLSACKSKEFRHAQNLVQAARDHVRVCDRGFGQLGLSSTRRLSLEDEEFWEWVHLYNIPILLGEGAKKGGCTLRNGYPTIALPGIAMGLRTKDAYGNSMHQSQYRLIPEVAFFATPGREINLCFDYETKNQTIKDIELQIERLTALFNRAGCEFKIIDLPGPEKGVDDFITAQGSEAFHQIFAKRLTFDRWRSRRYSQLNYPATVTLNQRFLGDLNLPESAKLVAIKSPKGTGKTESFVALAAQAMERGQRVLLLSHRVQLAEAICNRIGLNYVSEVRNSDEGALLGYGLCIDSLHPESQARFNAEHWHDCLVIIDEVEQLVWHLLDATTEVASKRTTVLEQLKALLENTLESDTGRVVIADADLSNLSIDFIHTLVHSPLVDAKFHIIINNYKTDSEAWLINSYEDHRPQQWLAGLDQELATGGKALAILHSQKRKSRYSTTALEALFAKRHPHLKILRIDSESISDPTHPAYQCITNLNEIVQKYDLVLASPTIETGVSIDIRGHFTSVWGCLNGVLSESTSRQSLARLRDPVPRHLWIAKRGLSKAANGCASKKAILSGEYRQAKVASKLLHMATVDSNLIDSYGPCLQIWAKMAARVNGGMIAYRDSILVNLEEEGHHLYSVTDVFDTTQLLEDLEAARESLYTAECEAIAQADGITQTKHDELKRKKAKTPDERHKERKFAVEHRYQVEVTPDLIAKDDDGWYPKLRLFYFLGMGKPFLKERDEHSLETTLKTSGHWLPSVNKSQIGTRTWLIEQLGVMALLNLDAEFGGGSKALDYDNAHPILLRLAKLAIANSWDIKNTLGLTISDRMSPIQIAQAFLGKIGIKLRCDRQEGGRGQRQRIYRYELPKDGRDEILAGWFSRDEITRQQKESVHTPSIDLIHSKECA